MKSLNLMKNDFKLEKYKAELQKWVNCYQYQHSEDLELFKASISAGANALKVSLIVNGGASIAILTFIGKLSEKHTEKIHLLSSSLYSFTIGILLVSIASGIVYVTQTLFQHRKVKFGIATNIITILLVLASYYTFYNGITSTYEVFTSSSFLKSE